MIRPTKVEAREGYRIWIRYSDGAEGEVDLSALAGKGVFAAWNEPGYFDRVHINEAGDVAWSDEIDLCPESLYMDLTGKSAEEVMPGLLPRTQDA